LPATNAPITSAFSTGVAAHPVGVPSQPLNATVSAYSLCSNGGYIDLTWSYPQNNGFYPNGTALGYTIEQIISGTSGVTAATLPATNSTSVTYRITAPVNSPSFTYGVTYSYRIFAVNGKGASPSYASVLVGMWGKYHF
jgi:hypothetical protein